jgi:hypothetical protein
MRSDETGLTDGSGRDPDGDALTFVWRMTSKPEDSLAMLRGANNATATFTADVPGPYGVRLTVSDPFGSVAQDEAVVTASGATTSPPPRSERRSTSPRRCRRRA